MVKPHYSADEVNVDGEPLLIDNYTKPEKKKVFEPKFKSSPNELFSQIDQDEAAALKGALSDAELKQRNINRQGGQNRKAVIAISPSGVELEYESLHELEEELGISPTSVVRIIKTGIQHHRRQWRGWSFKWKE